MAEERIAIYEERIKEPYESKRLGELEAQQLMTKYAVAIKEKYAKQTASLLAQLSAMVMWGCILLKCIDCLNQQKRYLPSTCFSLCEKRLILS